MAERSGLTAGQLSKVVKLLEVAKALHEQQAAIFEELDAVLGGKAGTAAKLKIIEQGFDEAWCQRYAPGRTGGYVWSWARDRANMKGLLKRMEPEEIVRRARMYLCSEDRFYSRQRHPFGLFVSSINQWAQAAPANGDLDLEPDPGICQHQPPCSSEAVHTRRKLAELRQ